MLIAPALLQRDTGLGVTLVGVQAWRRGQKGDVVMHARVCHAVFEMRLVGWPCGAVCVVLPRCCVLWVSVCLGLVCTIARGFGALDASGGY